MTSPFCFYYIALALPIPFYFLARTKRSRAWMAFWLPVLGIVALELLYWGFVRGFPDGIAEYMSLETIFLRPLRGKQCIYPVNLTILCALLAYVLAAKLPRKLPMLKALPIGISALVLILLFSFADRHWNLLPQLFFDPGSCGLPARSYDVTDFLRESAPTPYFNRGPSSVQLAFDFGYERLGPVTTTRAFSVYADANEQAERLAIVPAGTVYSDVESFCAPTIKRGWRVLHGERYGAEKNAYGYVRLDDLLAAFDGKLVYRFWIRHNILFQDYYCYRGANYICYLSPDYYRCFIPYEQYVLYLAIASLAVAEAVACIRKHRR